MHSNQCDIAISWETRPDGLYLRESELVWKTRRGVNKHLAGQSASISQGQPPSPSHLRCIPGHQQNRLKYDYICNKTDTTTTTTKQKTKNPLHYSCSFFFLPLFLIYSIQLTGVRTQHAASTIALKQRVSVASCLEDARQAHYSAKREIFSGLVFTCRPTALVMFVFID